MTDHGSYRKADWEKVRAEYAVGSMTKSEIAKKYGVRADTVRHRAIREKWDEERKKFHEESYSRAMSDYADKRAAELSAFADVVDRLTTVLQKVSADADQFYRQAFADVRTGEMHETVTQKIDARALRDYSNAVAAAIRAYRDVYGLPTKKERDSQAIAEERLEIDRKKAAVNGDENSAGGLVMIAARDDDEVATDGSDD